MYKTRHPFLPRWIALLMRPALFAAAGDGGGAPAAPAAPAVPAAPVVPAGQAADVQAQIAQALAEQSAQFARQLKEATGHDDFKALTEAQLKEQGKLQELLDAKTAGEQAYKQKFEQSVITNALLSAATGAIDPALVAELLASKATVDQHGVVSVLGKPVADALKALFSEKPFLAKPIGFAGSGTPAAAGTPAVDFSKLTAAQKMDLYRHQKTA